MIFEKNTLKKLSIVFLLVLVSYKIMQKAKETFNIPENGSPLNQLILRVRHNAFEINETEQKIINISSQLTDEREKLQQASVEVNKNIDDTRSKLIAISNTIKEKRSSGIKETLQSEIEELHNSLTELSKQNKTIREQVTKSNKTIQRLELEGMNFPLGSSERTQIDGTIAKEQDHLRKLYSELNELKLKESEVKLELNNKSIEFKEAEKEMNQLVDNEKRLANRIPFFIREAISLEVTVNKLGIQRQQLITLLSRLQSEYIEALYRLSKFQRAETEPQ